MREFPRRVRDDVGVTRLLGGVSRAPQVRRRLLQLHRETNAIVDERSSMSGIHTTLLFFASVCSSTAPSDTAGLPGRASPACRSGKRSLSRLYRRELELANQRSKPLLGLMQVPGDLESAPSEPARSRGC